VSELVKSQSRFVPDILVTGNGGDATSAGIMGFLREFQRQGAARAHPGSTAPQ
jgi:hypothetical protein